MRRNQASYAGRAALAELNAAVRRSPNETQNLLITLVLLFGIGIPLIRGCAAAGWTGPPEHDHALDRHIAYCVSLEPKYQADCLYPPDKELRD